MFFNLPQIKRKNLLFDPKQNDVFFGQPTEKINFSPVLVQVPLPIVPPQPSCSTQLYQSWIRALLLKSLQEQGNSVTCSKLSSAIRVKFVNICSYSTSVYEHLSTSCLLKLFTYVKCFNFILGGFIRHNMDTLLVCMVKQRIGCSCKVSIACSTKAL